MTLGRSIARNSTCLTRMVGALMRDALALASGRPLCDGCFNGCAVPRRGHRSLSACFLTSVLMAEELSAFSSKAGAKTGNT